jgi:hypothetical protein
LKKVSQQLEQHILSLYGQRGMREHEQRLTRNAHHFEKINIFQNNKYNQKLYLYFRIRFCRRTTFGPIIGGFKRSNDSNSREEQNSINSFGNHNEN